MHAAISSLTNHTQSHPGTGLDSCVEDKIEGFRSLNYQQEGS